MRILVVDDEETMRALIQLWLAKLGWETVLTGNDDEALKQYRNHGPFDAVLTDFIHPGIGGLKFCKIIRKQNHKQVIVAFTGAAPNCAREFGRLKIPVVSRPTDNMQEIIDLISARPGI